MPRYYFDIVEANKISRDDNGLDLRSSDQVRAAVARIILNLARVEVEDMDFAKLQIMVRDDTDYDVLTGTLQYLVEWH